MSELKTDFQNDVLNTSVNPYRKYQMINNSDGTVSFVDVTTYTQTGDEFGAKEINETNTAINELNSKLINLDNDSIKHDDIVDNLNVEDSNKVLSAKQGAVLLSKIKNLTTTRDISRNSVALSGNTATPVTFNIPVVNGYKPLLAYVKSVNSGYVHMSQCPTLSTGSVNIAFSNLYNGTNTVNITITVLYVINI